MSKTKKIIALIALVFSLGFGAYGLSQSQLFQGFFGGEPLSPDGGDDCGDDACIVTPGFGGDDGGFLEEEDDELGMQPIFIDDGDLIDIPAPPGGGMAPPGGDPGPGPRDPGFDADPNPAPANPAQPAPAPDEEEQEQQEEVILRIFVQVENEAGEALEGLSLSDFSLDSPNTRVDSVDEMEAGLYKIILENAVTFIGYQLTASEEGYESETQRIVPKLSDDEAEDNVYSYQLAALVLNLDSDGDGLLDEAELTHGTDPFDEDTDDDRLLDGAEVKTHKTDPLLKDTDGGSVNDGVEVRRGTNPKRAADDVEEVPEVVTPVETLPEVTEAATEFFCRELTISANDTKIKSSEEPKEVTLTVVVSAEERQTAFESFNSYLTQVLSSSQPEVIVLAEQTEWTGTLVVTTSSNDGELDHTGSSEEGRTLFVPLSGASNRETFSYDAAIGDSVTAYIQNESDCFDSLAFTEEATAPLSVVQQEAILEDDSFVCEKPFIDNDDELLCRMRAAEIVVGVGGGKFGSRTILEAEWVRVLLSSQGFTEADAKGLPSVNLPNYNAAKWYDPWYRIAVDQEIIRDYANPESPVTRATAAVLAARSPKSGAKTLFGWGPEDVPFTDLQKDPSKTATKASDFIQETYAILLMSQEEVTVPGQGRVALLEGFSDDTFRPNDTITREHAIYLLYRIILAWDLTSPLDTEGLSL